MNPTLTEIKNLASDAADRASEQTFAKELAAVLERLRWSNPWGASGYSDYARPSEEFVSDLRLACDLALRVRMAPRVMVATEDAREN